MIWENGIETCIISYMKRVASPGSMHDTIIFSCVIDIPSTFLNSTADTIYFENKPLSSPLIGAYLNYISPV